VFVKHLTFSLVIQEEVVDLQLITSICWNKYVKPDIKFQKL